MPYQTTVVSSFASLHQAIRSFLLANGWTDHSANVLGVGRVALELVDDPSWLRICIGKSVDNGTLVDRYPYNTYVTGGRGSPAFPMTAHLHLHPARHEFACALNYAGDKWEHLLAGELVRATEYPGGVYFFASAGQFNGAPGDLGAYYRREVTLSKALGATGCAASVAPFAFGSCRVNNGYEKAFSGSGVWAEPNDEVLAGRTWFGSGINYSNTNGVHGLTNELSKTLFENSLNNWNDSVVLVPALLVGYGGDSTTVHSYLGQPDNLRYVYFKNLEPGQILTLGHERWAVYPVERKTDTLYPAKNASGSGWIGIAVRQDDGGA